MLVLCGCAATFALPACDDGGTATEGDRPEHTPLTQTSASDDVRLTVTADRESAHVAEIIGLTLEVEGPADIEIEWPDVPTLVADFAVEVLGGEETATEDGRLIRRRHFALDSNLSGPRSIPTLTLRYGDSEVSTDPLTIEVLSAIEGEYNPAEFADIEGPVAVQKPPAFRPVHFVVGAILLAALGLVVWALLRRRSTAAATAAPPPPPHVWAAQALDALLAEKLVEKGEVQEFYFRLSGIVRMYIELRFGLMAPERTTQEFLVEVQRSDALRFGHKDLLGEFLTACDLVKFARHEPVGRQIDAAIDTVRRFVAETSPARSHAAVEEAAA